MYAYVAFSVDCALRQLALFIQCLHAILYLSVKVCWIIEVLELEQPACKATHMRFLRKWLSKGWRAL